MMFFCYMVAEGNQSVTLKWHNSKHGLITRVNGKYSLTSFGKVIYNYHLDIETAVNYYWKLKALDSIMTIQLSSSSGRIKMPAEEQVKLVDKLIDNNEIKNILLPTTIATSTTTTGTKQGKEEEEEEQHAKVSTIVSNRY